MALKMFENTLAAFAHSTSPNLWYRDLHQAFIDSQWDNTVSVETMLEQKTTDNPADLYEYFEFEVVEAWVNTVVGQSSTGQKTGYDFLQLIFQDIEHPKYEGRYYIIRNQYYISYFDNRVVDVDANLSVRRCNEWMRIKDPANGAIYQIPCVVDYDMAAPANRVTNAIITPNNHAVVKVQQNATTDRLFKTNKRFILGGRPFKITGMQNATNQFIDSAVSGSMEIDLFLDEIWEEDDLENGVAFNGLYDYTIELNANSLSLTPNASGQILAKVLLNGEEVDRPISWSSSSDAVVEITEDGLYQVVGEIGESALITASLEGNVLVFDSVRIVVVDVSELRPEVYLEPKFTSIGEHSQQTISVFGVVNGLRFVPDSVYVSVPDDIIGKYLSYDIKDNQITFMCISRCPRTVKITIGFTSEIYGNASVELDIKLTNLLW